MNLNKCERCGCFFASKNSVCPNCVTKDENDIQQLKNYLNDSDFSVSINTISYETGISIKNVNRFLQDKSICKTLTGLGLDYNNVKTSL